MMPFRSNGKSTCIRLCLGMIAVLLSVSSAQAQSVGGAERDDPACMCGADPTGAAFCFINTVCLGTTPCTQNSDCPTGYRGLVDNCCGPPLNACACAPDCEKPCSKPGSASAGDCVGNFPACPEEPPIPASSEWGLVAMTLLGLAVGTTLFGRHRMARS